MLLTTAVILYMPTEVQAVAVPIARRFALNSLIQVAPHITINYPFVPIEGLRMARDVLRECCLNIRPFEITLAGYGFFPKVVYLKLVDPSPVQALIRAVYERFPAYPPYRGLFPVEDITPHVTVGLFDDEAERDAALTAADLPPYDPITVRVENVHLTYGSDAPKLPFLTYDVIWLDERA